MARNIYGLSAWQFKQMKMRYEALPQDEKQKIAEAEVKMVDNIFKAQEQNLLANGFTKVGEGKFEKTSKKCYACEDAVAGTYSCSQHTCSLARR